MYRNGACTHHTPPTMLFFHGACLMRRFRFCLSSRTCSTRGFKDGGTVKVMDNSAPLPSVRSSTDATIFLALIHSHMMQSDCLHLPCGSQRSCSIAHLTIQVV